MTTYAQFIDRLSSMHPVGVTRIYGLGETPPASLNNADLPAMWVQNPAADFDVMTFGSGPHWAAYRAQLVVAVLAEAAGLSLGKAFEDSITVMDNLVLALNDVRPAQSKPTWTIRLGRVTVANINYWAVIAEVTASG